MTLNLQKQNKVDRPPMIKKKGASGANRFDPEAKPALNQRIGIVSNK